MIVDCTDTFATKYLIADAAEITGIPLVWGSVLRYQGSVSVFRTGSAHLRDLFPTTPKTLESCAETGVLALPRRLSDRSWRRNTQVPGGAADA